MGKRKGKKKNNNGNIRSKGRRRGTPRSVRPVGPTTTSTLRRYGYRAIRSLISVLPGSQLLSPIVDFIFDVKAQAKTAKPVDGKLVVDEMISYGLSKKIFLSRANLSIGCREAISRYTVTHNKSFHSIFREVMISEVTVILQPDNVVRQRSGYVAMGFEPLYSRKNYVPEKVFPSRFGITRMASYVEGTVDRPLQLHYKIRPSDDDAYGYHQISKAVSNLDSTPDPWGVLVIIFEQPNRPSYGEFSADDVAFTIQVQSKVSFREPLLMFDLGDPKSFGLIHSDLVLTEVPGQNAMSSLTSTTEVMDAKTCKCYHVVTSSKKIIDGKLQFTLVEDNDYEMV